jgi:hypothetical protein
MDFGILVMYLIKNVSYYVKSFFFFLNVLILLDENVIINMNKCA